MNVKAVVDSLSYSIVKPFKQRQKMENKTTKLALAARLAGGLLFTCMLALNVSNFKSTNSEGFNFSPLAAFANELPGGGADRGSDKCTPTPGDASHGSCVCETKVLWENCGPVGATRTY